MKRLFAYTFLALFLAINAHPATAAEATDNGLQKAATTLDALTTQNAQQAEHTRKLAAMEESALKARLADLKQQLAAKDKEYKSLQHELTGLTNSREGLQADLEEQADDLKTVEGTIRIAAKQAADDINGSLAAPAHPQWQQTVSALLHSDRYPGVPAIRSLVDVRFEQMEAAKNHALAPGKYMSASGQPASGDILRLGLFTAIYRDQSGNVGYLKLEEGGERLAVVPEVTDWLTTSRIEDYIAGKAESVPMDISNGAVFARLLAGKDTREWVRAGGLLLWPILAAGALGLLIGLERLVFLLRQRKGSRTFFKQFMDTADKGDWQTCESLLEGNGKSPAGRVLARLIKERGQGPDVLEATLQESMLEEMPRLERFLSTLQVLAVISPLLGLLGTVTGMINTFQVITVFGTGDPRMMSGGISEALVTTQAGLAVAIPIMLIAHFLKRRVSGVLDDMDAKGTAFTALLLRRRDCADG
ncbi:MAG: MotA/TolQ/ExbB proton channel family protein [Desulfovibrio sp.]|uniref:MotA/TolQ/ExbB proton channel family protein n=1 Tax=Desulfovibrio sp. 7SRBS1 TaxID=3378064 RepID=UPI003B3FB953